jgi:hypothetical protein
LAEAENVLAFFDADGLWFSGTEHSEVEVVEVS